MRTKKPHDVGNSHTISLPPDLLHTAHASRRVKKGVAIENTRSILSPPLHRQPLHSDVFPTPDFSDRLSSEDREWLEASDSLCDRI